MKNLKRLLFVLLACCMLTGTFFAGCAPDEDEPTPTPPEETVEQNYYIVAENDDTVNWAAKELADFTQQMNGKPVTIYNAMPDNASGFALYLGTSSWATETFPSADLRIDELKNDGFALVPVEDGLVVTSNYGRGVSYGVYELLERNGVNFYASYELGTYVPENGNVNYRLKNSEVSNPDFGYREIFNDTSSLAVTDYGKKEIERLYIWLYRNRYNTITGHGPIPAYGVSDLLDTLGFAVSAGGHKYGFPNTDQHPEWRRTDATGSKVSTGNFCISQPDALMYVAQQYLNALEADPEIERFNILGEDVYGGSWCYCDECSVYTPNQQFAIVVQVIAEKVAEVRPDVILQYSLYHDTLDIADIRKCSLDNVQGFYWPRERCLAHDLQDDSCEKCATYRRYLETMCEKFKTNSFCGYYGDAVLYNGMEANANEQVAADLKFAKEVGCDDCANLMFSMFGTTQSDEMMMTFARCMWDVDADWKGYVESYYANLFGFDAETTQKVMELRYDFTESIFSFCGYAVDYGVEGITMSQGEQDFAKPQVGKMLKADQIMEQLKQIYSEAKANTADKDIQARLDMKYKYAEFSRIRALAYANVAKGIYIKTFGPDDEFTGSYSESYQTGVDYLRDSMEYAAQYDETVWGHNAYLLQNGLGQQIIDFWTWQGDLSA